MIRSSLLSVTMILAIYAGITTPAYADLGGNIAASSIGAPTFKRNVISSPGAALMTIAPFFRNETLLDGGGLITEFSDSSGTIFAITWDTPAMPDLSALLGAYKKPWLDAQRNSHANSGRNLSARHFSASTGDWSIVSTGHLRAYRGYSWLRSAVPPGFDLAELTK